MGAYLSVYYEEEIKFKIHHHKSEKRREEQAIPKKQAELVTLSDDILMERTLEESPIYSLIRAVVIVIFIIFCAIAVTTVNNFEKMKEFTNTAVQMNESIDGNTIDETN